MYKFIKKFLKKNIHIRRLFYFIRDKFRIFYNQKRRSRFLWNLRKGDTVLSLDYPLNSDSVFFDVGAHIGDFSIQISKKFDCKIYAFEPLNENYELLIQNVKNFPKIECFEVALSNFDGESEISNLGASASLHMRSEGRIFKKINVKSFNSFMKEENIKHIDLIKMNIEGSEYELLNQIIDSGHINNINHLQIQFHNFVHDSKNQRRKIRKKLQLTHINKFNFPFIWERWDLK